MEKRKKRLLCWHGIWTLLAMVGLVMCAVTGHQMVHWDR